MKRIKLQDRILPCYTHGEEIMNMVTHITGGGLAVIALLLCLFRAFARERAIGVICSLVYGLSMIGVYTISSIYHGLRPSMGKKVMQVITVLLYVL
jgi:hemolysin III